MATSERARQLLQLGEQRRKEQQATTSQAGGSGGTGSASPSKSRQQELLKLGEERRKTQGSNNANTAGSDWVNRYNRLQETLSGEYDYEAVRPTVDKLISDYRSMRKSYADTDYGESMYNGYLGLLSMQERDKDLRRWQKQQEETAAARAKQASGILPEEAEAMRQEREQLQTELDTYKNSEAYKQGRQTAIQHANLAGFNSGMVVQPVADSKESELTERIADIDAQLTLYDRLDGFQDTRIKPLTGKEGFSTARADFRSGNAAQGDTDELGEYLDWYNALDTDTQERLLEGRFNAQAPQNREIVRSTPSTMGKHWERMNEDEINAYYYIANTEGLGAAKEFLEELQVTLDKRHTEGREAATVEQMEGSPTWANALRGAATVGANIVGGPMAFASDVVREAKGEDFNPYSNAHYLQNITSVTRSAAADDIQKTVAGDGESKFWNGVGEVAANAYQAGLSTLDSLAGMATMGGAYTVSMGMGAASSRMRELYEAGATDQEIYVGAIGSGILEALFEKVSLEYFTTDFIKANPEKWVKKALLQAGVEGSEEFFTEISNMMLDAVNRGVNSDHNQRVRELMNDPENPMSRAEAEQQAAKEDAMDVFWAFMGGVMSGGMSSIGGAVMESSRQNQVGQDAMSRNVQGDIIAEAQELRAGDELAASLQAKQEQGTLGKKHSDATKLGRLIEKNVADMTARDMEAVTSAVEARLEEENQSANRFKQRDRVRDARATAEALVKSLAGESLTVTDRFHLALNEKYVDQVKSEIYSVADGRTDNNQWVQNIGTYSFAPGTFGSKETHVQQAGREAMETAVKEAFGGYSEQILQSYRPGQNRTDYVAEMQKVYQAGLDGVDLKQAPETKTLEDWQRQVAWDMGQGKSDYDYDNNQGFVTIKGEATPVNIVGVAAAGKGQLMLRTDDGSMVAANEVTFGSYSQSKVYSVIASMGVDASTANQILGMSQESKLDLNTFARAVQDAYYAGRNGIPLADIQGDRMANKLSQEERKLAWQAGRAAARNLAIQKGKRVLRGKHRKAAGGLTVEVGAQQLKNLNEQQEAGMNAAKVLSAMGLDVTVYASTEEQRAKGMENGNIRLSDGSIRIDLNAGDSGEGVMAWALSHEFTHFVEELSPEKFQTFQEVLFGELGQNGQDVTTLIEEKVVELSSQQQYSELSEERLMDIATSEVVAEMMEPMLTDTDAIARISDNLRQQDKGLWEKIKTWLSGLVEKLKNAYKDLTPGSAIALQTRSIVTQSEEILNAWVDVATDAVVNYNLQDGQKNNTPGGVKFSLRGKTQQQITANYQAEVDSILNMQDTTARQLIVGYTPSLYESIGMPSLPLTIGSGHVYSAAKTEAEAKQDGNFHRGVHYHGLGDTAIKDIYSKIQDPVMIIAAKDVNKNANPLRSTHSVVTIMDVGTAGKSLLVPVEITAERNVNGVQMDVNTISSVYEKSVQNLVAEAIAMENTGEVGIFYAKKEALTLPVAGVQFPVQLQQSIASGKIVHHLSEKVNMNISEATQSRQFKRWFGDWQNDPANASKVVNGDGTPKVMYHGSPAQFTIFEKKKAKSGGMYGRGFYFTNSESHAGQYGNQYSVYLNIRNPLEHGRSKVSRRQVQNYLEAVAENEDYSIENYGTYDVEEVTDNIMGSNDQKDAFDVIQDINVTAIGDLVEAVELFNEVNGTKFDGIVVPTETVAFYPSQIKSATDNVGTFDASNPDIRFSQRSAAQLERENEKLRRDKEYLLQDEQKNNTPGGVQYSQRYSYEYFVNKPDMEVTDVDNFHDISRDSIIQKAIENAKSVGHVNANGNAVVHVKDIGRDVIIGKRALAHGLDRRTRLQAPALANVGNILSNSIKINELNPRSENIRESYILVGAAKGEDGFYAVTFVVNRHSNEVMDIDVLYAANVKKEPAALLPKITENTATPTGSTISIAKLLEVVNDLYPYILPEDVLKHFGYDSRPDGKLGEAVLYSQRSAAQLERENEKLRRDKEYLKELVKIQRQGNKDVVPTRASVNHMAESLKKETGARGSTEELARLLDDFYRYIGKGNLDTVTMDQVVGKAADWLQEHRPVQRDPYAQEVLDWMKKRHVSLSQTQVDEIKYQYGSLREFQSAIKGSIIIDQKAITSLDQLWQEGASQFADQFDLNMSEGDMPGAFADLVERLRSSESTETAEARYYQEEIHRDLMDRVYDTYFSVKPIDSVSDEMQKKIDALKEKRKAERKKYKEKIEGLKTEKKGMKKENVSTLRAMQDIRREALNGYRKQQTISDRRLRWLYEKQYRLIMEDYQQQLDKAKGGKTSERVEGWRKTEERGSLQRTLGTLNKMMLHPTKSAFVPDHLQPAVIKAMEAMNNYRLSEEIDMEKIRSLRRELDKLLLDGARKNEARIRQINRQLDKLQGDYGSVQDCMAELKRGYAELRESNEGKVKQIYDEVVEDLIDNAMEKVGETSYNDLSVQQLEELNKAYTAILKRIITANNTFAYGRQMEISKLAETVGEELKRAPDREKLSGEQVGALEKFGWNNLKPEYAFQRLGSATMTTLYHNLRKGEDVFYQDVEDARGFALGAMARHGYQNWKDQTIEYESVDGKKFSLNLEERMSLYAYSRRRQAIEHLTKGGIVLNENTKRTVKGFLGIQTEKVFHDYNNYRLSLDTIQAIGDSLTQQQRAFAEEMQGYLSTVCADKNNEISRALYGVSKAKEKYYWPLKASSLFSERVRNQQQNPGNRQKNAGHMKATTPHANNPVEVAGFLETWGNHVNNTAMYHAFTLPMEDFLRVYNFNSTAGVTDESIVQLITKKHGKGATDYIDQFLKDLNSGVRADPRESIASSLTSKFKKGAVSASLSVAIQQPSAVGRAFAVIDFKYFSFADARYYFGGLHTKEAQKEWETAKKYAPVIGIKEMGRFDVNMGRSTVDFITGAGETGFMATVDKYAGILPERADQATWLAMWNAAKRQCKAQGYKEEALNVAAGKLFTECITKTQVYDSVFSRSGNMRSKSLYMNMATSFMAEPTTTANMVQSAYADMKNKNFKAAGRKMGSVAAATLLNAILASLVYAARDDDEDKPYKEKYLKSLTSELLDGINPLGYVPVVKDVWSLLQGYDVERSDMALWSTAIDIFNQLKDAHEEMASLSEDDADYEEKLAAAQKKVRDGWLDAAGAICNLLGIPAKNVLREIRALVNTWETVGEGRKMDGETAQYAMWEAFQENLPEIIRTEDSKADQLYKALVSGSDVWVERMKASYTDEKAFDSAVRGVLRDYDKRIRAAAKSLDDADSTQYKETVQEILEEGHFTEEQVEDAVLAEAKAIKGEFEGYSTKTIEKFVDLYEDNLLTAEQFTDFWEYRSEEDETGKRLHDKAALITYIGKMKVNTKAKDTLYLQVLKYSEDDLESTPWHSSGYTVWEAKAEHPALAEAGDSAAQKYVEIQSKEISAEMFAKVWMFKYEKGEDDKRVYDWKDVRDYIDALPISDYSKDELFLALGYSEKTLKKIRWS